MDAGMRQVGLKVLYPTRKPTFDPTKVILIYREDERGHLKYLRKEMLVFILLF
jgi:hypothetical protein